MLGLSETTIPIQSLVATLIAVTLGQEFALHRRLRSEVGQTDYRPFLMALALLASAGAASLADVTRVWCDPTNHWLQGHAVWHVLSAAALYSLFVFYSRLPAEA